MPKLFKSYIRHVVYCQLYLKTRSGGGEGKEEERKNRRRKEVQEMVSTLRELAIEII